MPVHNSEVAEIFEQVADLLEIEGANQFRVRSYRQTAETATALSRSLEDMVSQGEDLTELSGIGEDLTGKIEKIVHTGGLQQLEEIEARTPPTLTKLLDVEGLGPKRVHQIHDELGITTLDELEKAARETLGVRSRDPRWALAYKFPPRRANTRIKQIKVQVGRTGQLTPVAYLEPVQIGGVEISRASLHNQSEIERKDIRIGDLVLVERAGDVIPQVVKPITDERDGSEKPFHMPDECPVCGAEVVLSDDKKQAHCTNLNCPAQVRERLQHYAFRDAMDIEGLGEKRAGQLVSTGLVERISALYNLKKDDLLSLEGYADKSAQNLLDEIESSKETTLARFLYALGIPLVGSHIARVLAEHFGTLDALQEASRQDLEPVREIGPEVARSLTTFFDQEQNRQVLEDLREAGLTLENPNAGEGNQSLDGLTFVFTGELERWTRDEVKRLVERAGGRATSSVSGETDYVVAGTGTGSKLDEAQAQDVPVLDEEEFVEFLESHRE